MENTFGTGTANKKAIVLKTALQYAVITLGCIIYSLGISLFILPSNLSSGGMTGISLIVDHLIKAANPSFPLDNGIWLIIFNVPMLILGLIFFGWKFLVSTGYATVCSSLLMTLWNNLFKDAVPFEGSNILINSVIGGVLFGIGMGLIFRMGASTAGTDVIVKLLRKKFRHIKTGMISFVTDMIIVLGSLLINTNLETLFYTALTVFVFTIVFDFVLYGGNTAKTVLIITQRDKSGHMTKRILEEVESGATLLDAKGAYTLEDKVLLICVVKPFLYPRLRDVVREEDKKAFMIVTSAKEIYGEGYRDQDAEEL